MPRTVVVAAIGFVTGVLLAFGAVVALFDWAHQGPNTEPWQAVVGWFLPPAVIVAMLAWSRGGPDRRRPFAKFLLALGIGILLGFVGLAVLIESA